MDSNKALIVFQGKQIRRTWHNDEWHFSVVDVVEVLTDSVKPRDYWYQLKKRELQYSGIELSTFCRQLKLVSSDGKKYKTDCANTEKLFRIIQSIPSKKAEPFKRWLAKVGYERIQEIENPELAQDRVKEYYELKGYPKDWIDKRLRGIVIRQDLTDEWDQRGIEDRMEFAILTNEISKATFDVSVKEHKKIGFGFSNLAIFFYRTFLCNKKIKGLDPKFKNQNLRDHMNDWELILTMIGEKATTDITISKDSKGFVECRDSALEGGTVAKNTRKEIEQKTGKSVISDENYMHLTGKKQQELIKK